MKALVILEKEKISFDSVPDPSIIESTDAIVKVGLCAICGSDLHVYHGREQGIDPCTVMGHEFMGEVVEAGKAVKQLTKGKRVLSPFSSNCGSCFYCLSGMTARCERGALFGWMEHKRGLQGGQAEYIRVPHADATLVPVPDGVHDEEALLLGDIFPTGFHCASQAGVSKDKTVVVIGCGAVGLMSIRSCFLLGAEKVFAVDLVQSRLDAATSLGAIPLNANASDLQSIVRDATGGRGADAVLEAVGSSPSLRLAYQLVRPGGTISCVGVNTDSSFAFSPAEAYDKNLTLKTGRCPARALIPLLIPYVLEKKVDLRSVISHRLELSQGVNAYSRFAARAEGWVKVVLSP